MPAAGGKRVSLWAVASLLCSLAVCPPLCLIGPLLGIWAIIDFRGKPFLTGRRYAIAGIAVGLLFTVAWTVGGVWWHFNVRRPMIEGPEEALTAGFAGDLSAFQAEFTGPGASADPQAAASFIAELRDRYGAFQGSRQDQDAALDPADVDRRRPAIPYVLEFSEAEVKAEAVFVIREEGGFGFVLKWAWIRVSDPDRVDLVYPPPQ